MVNCWNNSGSIQIRSASTGDVLQTLATAQPAPILTAAWSPDGARGQWTQKCTSGMRKPGSPIISCKGILIQSGQ
jgi:hypothetical protein